MIPEKDVALLESAFKRYYFEHPGMVQAPGQIREREFGYQRFNSGMIRHVSLKDDRELRLVLMNNKPADVYCSNGYYSFPSMPMTEKDWKGADLIFDIDAKDLGLGCRPGHTCAKCPECGHVSPGPGDDCPDCSSKKATPKSLACGDCIKGAKREVAKLSKILTDDLGVPEDGVSVYFSGNEGFHVHVSDAGYRELGSKERRELVDYVMFNGAIPKTFGMRGGSKDRSGFPSLDEDGWRGRVAKELFGSESRRSKAISAILAGGVQQFAGRLQEIAPRIGACIDPNVTMDIHRVFRLAGTLNSKSGLTKMPCEDLGGFDPYADACHIDDSPVEVLADCPVRFSLRKKRFGAYAGERVEVPTYAAVYLICKGFATSV